MIHNKSPPPSHFCSAITLTYLRFTLILSSSFCLHSQSSSRFKFRPQTHSVHSLVPHFEVVIFGPHNHRDGEVRL